MDVRAGSVISNRLPDGLYYPPGSRTWTGGASAAPYRARGRPRKASDRGESVGRLLWVLGLRVGKTPSRGVFDGYPYPTKFTMENTLVIVSQS